VLQPKPAPQWSAVDQAVGKKNYLEAKTQGKFVRASNSSRRPLGRLHIMLKELGKFFIVVVFRAPPDSFR
jgi:hypothetical protein